MGNLNGGGGAEWGGGGKILWDMIYFLNLIHYEYFAQMKGGCFSVMGGWVGGREIPGLPTPLR